MNELSPQNGSLVVQDLSKRFKARKSPPISALESVSFHVDPGEVLALLGPSGSGKTTTLRIIAGLETPDSGRVLIGKTDLVSTPPARREIGMTMQEPTALPHLTVRENLDLGLRFERVRSEDRHERLSRIAERLGIFGLLDRYPHELSVGQKQRVSLGRALIGRPRALLFDEPCQCLDPGRRADLREEIRRVVHWADIPAVLVTHDPYEALLVADRIGVMQSGRLTQIGSADEVYRRPTTVDNAILLSPLGLNQIEGEIWTEESSTSFRSKCGRIQTALTLRDNAPAPSQNYPVPAILALRPDEVQLAPVDASNSQRCGEVLESCPKGPFLHSRVRFGSEEWGIVEPKTSKPFEQGHAVNAGFADQGGLLFELETGALTPFVVQSTDPDDPNKN